MADYDWSTPTYTPEEIKEQKRQEDEKKREEKYAYNCALAEGRRLLLTRQAEGMMMLNFLDEIRSRMMASDTGQLKRAWRYLEDNGEFKSNLGRGLKVMKPLSPDVEYLSDYRVVKVPSELTLVEEPEVRVSTNSSRRQAGYDFLEKQLEEGATILVRDKDGNTSEIVFTEDKLK
jgi:hypothetical protein